MIRYSFDEEFLWYDAQLIAGSDPADDDPADDDPELDPEVDPEPEPEVDPELDPEANPEPAHVDPDDTTPWVKKRLARAERSFERKFMDEVGSLSEGVQVGRDELPKAARLWNLLKFNPELSKEIDAVIAKAVAEKKIRDLRAVAPDSRVNSIEARLELKEAMLDLQDSDPLFRKHKQDILKWAEDEELDITNERSLKLAFRAWKGENATKLVVGKSQPKATTPAKPDSKAQQRKAANLVGGRAPVRGSAIDYRKASASDILKREGMSLLTDD